ncbi:glycosyltransferase [Lichenihabitans psoromatis]|uniref:glycosyltransferase n=1 Tax=Lichenihabitans psoromatis TaxID=2528642 RepID=UPI0010384CF3|nr:glycosyltransferase [Lichenihabitans psoromatis]
MFKVPLSLFGRERSLRKTNEEQRNELHSFNLLVAQADSQRDDKNFSVASTFYQQALELQPDRTDIRVQLGNMLKDSGAFERAEVHYRLALNEQPRNSDVQIQLGRALIGMGRHTEAKRCFEHALLIDPKSTESKTHIDEIARTHRELKDDPETQEIYSLLSSSVLFDREFYLKTNPFLSATSDPIQHYIDVGSNHHVSTSAQFDGALYYARLKEFRGSGVPALAHALKNSTESFGKPEDEKVEWDGEPVVQDVIVNLERLRAESFAFRYDLRSTRAFSESVISSAAEYVNSNGRKLLNPRVSIIIPVYGQTLWTLNCLHSISRHVSRYSFEVVVYDDCSPDQAFAELLSKVRWCRYLRAESNVGFIKACNAAVQQCDGEYVVLLNSDTRVCDGWLDELIGTFDLHSDVGLVGSKLFNEDGSLQEAGCIVWRDGSSWNYGRGSEPNESRFCFAREVDYCSGAAIALTKRVWNDLGGFDEYFAPAYFEDVDLAYRVRSIGLSVWYQPLARVIHYEGRTHGTDVESGVKAFQLTNQARFFERWSGNLSSNRVNGAFAELESDRSRPLRLLAMDAETPTPNRDAGSVMAFELMHILHKLGWHVSFRATHDSRYKKVYSESLARIGIEAISGSSGARSSEEFVRHYVPTVHAVLGFRVTVLAPLIDIVREHNPEARVLFHDIDLHYLRMEREAQMTDSLWMKRLSVNMKVREMKLIADVDCTIVPSFTERDIIQKEIAANNVVVYAYTSAKVETPTLSDTRRNIAFVGGFRHAPNVDAMHYYLTEIWPEACKKLPVDACMIVIGSDAPRELTMLANDRVIFVGFLDDLTPTLSTCRVLVAPLRFGAGLKGKVVTALAHGVPCVATTTAVEGMGLTSGKEILVADDRDAFICEIERLYQDDAVWSAIRVSGHSFVDQFYSLEAGKRVAEAALAVADATWLKRKMLPINEKIRLLN